MLGSFKSFVTRTAARRRMASAEPPAVAQKSILGSGPTPGAGGVPGTNPHRYKELTQEAFVRNVIGYRAATLVAQSIASLPLLERYRDEDSDTGPLLEKLESPNVAQTRTTFLEQLTLYLLYAGDTYVLGQGVFKGQEPTELWPTMPNAVQIVTSRGYPMPVAFQVQVPGSGSRERYDVDLVTGRCDLLRITRPHPAGDLTSQGVAPLGAAAGRVDLHNAGTQWNYSMMRRGGRPSGAFVHDEELDDETYRHLQDEVDRMVSGADQAGRPLVLDGGLRWETLASRPHDMDWLEGQRDAARDVALAAGVPPQLVGIPDSQTYSNYREARMAFYEDTVLPQARHILGALSQWLAPALGREGAMLVVDSDNVEALSVKRERFWDKVEASKVLTINEKRAELGYAPLDGGDDLYTTPNQVPLNMLADGIGLQPSDTAAPGAEDTGSDAPDPSAVVRDILQRLDDGQVNEEEAVAELAQALGVDEEIARGLLDEADQHTGSQRRAQRSLSRASTLLQEVG